MYSSYTKCAKCGCEKADVEWDKSVDVLNRRCQRCGYIWTESPLDRAAVATAIDPDDEVAREIAAAQPDALKPSLPHELGRVCETDPDLECVVCKYCNSHMSRARLAERCLVRELLHEWSVMGLCLYCGVQETGGNYSERCGGREESK